MTVLRNGLETRLIEKEEGMSDGKNKLPQQRLRIVKAHLPLQARTRISIYSFEFDSQTLQFKILSRKNTLFTSF
jgi:hypothetical protein